MPRHRATPDLPPRHWLLGKDAPESPVALELPPAALVGRFNVILNAVGAAFGTPQMQLKGPRRARDVAQARFAAVALILELCPELSLPQIGYLLGNRDHATIIAARRRAGELLHPDRHSAQWRARYQQARALLTDKP